MAKRSQMAQARHDDKRQVLEAELAKYQQLIRELRASSESTLAKTHKQKEYHLKIQAIEHELLNHGK